MARPEIAAALAKDFVDVKIDQDRMTNGATIAALLRQGRAGGIPWFAFLDQKLRARATSDGANGNVGFQKDLLRIPQDVVVMGPAICCIVS